VGNRGNAAKPVVITKCCMVVARTADPQDWVRLNRTAEQVIFLRLLRVLS
jgi:hypothetical protein